MAATASSQPPPPPLDLLLVLGLFSTGPTGGTDFLPSDECVLEEEVLAVVAVAAVADGLEADAGGATAAIEAFDGLELDKASAPVALGLPAPEPLFDWSARTMCAAWKDRCCC